MNIKKHFCILLSVFVLSTQLGVSMNIVYCCGTVSSIRLLLNKLSTVERINKTSCCARFSITEVKKKNCCKNFVIPLQNHDFTEKIDLNPVQLPLFGRQNNPELAFVVLAPIFCSKQEKYFQKNINAPPLFRLYHKYIFYG